MMIKDHHLERVRVIGLLKREVIKDHMPYEFQAYRKVNLPKCNGTVTSVLVRGYTSLMNYANPISIENEQGTGLAKARGMGNVRFSWMNTTEATEENVLPDSLF